MATMIWLLLLILVIVVPSESKWVCKPESVIDEDFDKLLEITEQEQFACQDDAECLAKTAPKVKDILARKPPDYLTTYVVYKKKVTHREISLSTPTIPDNSILMDVNREIDTDKIIPIAKEAYKQCQNGPPENFNDCLERNVYDLVRIILWEEKVMEKTVTTVTFRAHGVSTELPFPLGWACKSFIYNMFGEKVGVKESIIEECRHQYLPSNPKEYIKCVFA